MTRCSIPCELVRVYRRGATPGLFSRRTSAQDECFAALARRYGKRANARTEAKLADEAQVIAIDVEASRRESFERLFEGRLDESYRLARLILRDAQEAEDATHDAFVRAWRDHHRLRDPERFEAWFGRILVNACRDALRRRSHRRHDDLARAPEPRAPHDAHRQVDERDALERAFSRLSPDHRIAVVLRFYRDLTVEDVARLVGAPIGTVRSRLHYGLKQLRRALEEMER